MENWLVCKILKAVIMFFMDFTHCVYLFIRRILAVVLDHYCDKRLGIETSGLCIFEDKLSLYKDGNTYVATSYYRLRKMIEYLKLSRDDIFVDFGCGKGRVIFFVATQKLKKVVGIELKRELVDIARENLNHLRLNNTPIEIIKADAATFNPKVGTVFYMYAPFGWMTLEKVIDNIKGSLITNPRKIRIVYFEPAHCNLLNSQDWLAFEGEIDKTNIFVWHNILYPKCT